VLPTTYAGSEATPVLGETHEGQKSTARSMKVLPEVIIYDVELTYGLPPGLSLVSGINAIAHAVEALYAREANPVISNLAEQGIAALGRALPQIVSDPAGA
jgi:maleylacetate reductase